MAKPGPQKMPQKLAKMKGNYRPSRYGDDQSERALDFINKDSGYPDPPEILGEHGRRTWVQIMQRAMMFEDWICWDELNSLTAYCGAVDVLYQTTGQPYDEVTEKGDRRVSVDFKVWKDACLLIDRFSQRFGLDPASKSGFNFGEKKDEDDFTEWRL